MLGYIVKILNDDVHSGAQSVGLNQWPHSIGDYGKVIQSEKYNIMVQTAHDKARRYSKDGVEVYSRTPVDLILIGGRSVPANKYPYYHEETSPFNNSRDLRDTYIKVTNPTDWNRALAFYNDRGYHFDGIKPGYTDGCSYLSARADDKLLYGLHIKASGFKVYYPEDAKDITTKVLFNKSPFGVTGDQPHVFQVGDVVQYTSGRHGWHDDNPKDTQGVVTKIDKPDTDLYIVVDRQNGHTNEYAPSDLILITPSFQAEYYCHFIPSPSTTMTETQSLEQLKFNKYVEENKDDIVELSETMDNALESLNEIGQIFGDFYIKVKTTSVAMSNAFEQCNKSKLDDMFFDLKAYEGIIFSKEYKDAAAAVRTLEKKIQAFSSK